MLPDAANWRRILSCTIAVTIVGIGCTEYYARSQNYPVLFETSPDLWATQWFKFEASEDARDYTQKIIKIINKHTPDAI